jgi:hypothetical protein
MRTLFSIGGVLWIMGGWSIASPPARPLVIWCPSWNLSSHTPECPEAVTHYTMEATNARGVVSMKTPLTAAEAYSRSVQLRHCGFTNITAINSKSGARITDVQRLLRDLDD